VYAVARHADVVAETWRSTHSGRRTNAAQRSAPDSIRPEQRERLRADPARARAALDETIRFDSPVQTFFRTTTRAVTIDGVPICEGEKILMVLAAANRDPRRWDEADRFDSPERATCELRLVGGENRVDFAPRAIDDLADLHERCLVAVACAHECRAQLHGRGLHLAADIIAVFTVAA
jgi:hypothetical protein